MKKYFLLLSSVLINISIFACPVCERNKPKILKGVVHGSNPQNNWDFIIVGTILIIAVFTLFYSVKWLLKPNEKNPNHIKYSLLNEE